MNGFFESLRTKVKGIESMHQCGDILIKEDVKTGECTAYSREDDKKKKRLIDMAEVEITIPNINNNADNVAYRVISLPGGRCRVINNQEGKFSLHSLGDICYGLSGEEVSPSVILDESTIQEYIRRYQKQRGQMTYLELVRAEYNGQSVYIGKNEEGYEELFGNVLLKMNEEELDKLVRQGEVLAGCMYDFGSSKCSYIGFTKEALQNIAQRDKEREERK